VNDHILLLENTVSVKETLGTNRRLNREQ
jgi:hypothetical protein